MGKGNKLRGKRILVTGGKGYLGRKLIDSLVDNGANVFSIDIKKKEEIETCNYHQIDIRDENKLSKIVKLINPQIVYHLAASLDRTRDFDKVNNIFDINIKGTVNLLNSIKNIKIESFIFTSTSEIYGGPNAIPPFNEKSDVVPVSPYALSKYNGEMIIKTFSSIYKKNYTILRLFNFYGTDMPLNFFISDLLEKLKNNENFDMTFGEQKRDYLHVSDVVKAMILVVDNKAYNEVFNICSGKAQTIKEIALYLKKTLNSKSKINFGALAYRENEIWSMVGDCEKFRKKFNFTPNNWLNFIC